MQRAGAAGAEVIAESMADRLARGVVIFTGPGNNGGDGWVVAHELAGRGVPVAVREIIESRTPDAMAERESARVAIGSRRIESPGVVVDALLGTGARGGPTGAIADAVRTINAARSDGASIVALDMPTGVDASSGTALESVLADITISFGTVKRGQLLARGRCGEIVVVDIGLGEHALLQDGSGELVDEAWVATVVPPIDAGAHKGTRRRVVIAGGSRGMAGAVMLAAHAALRSGIGMVRLLVDEASMNPVQSGVIEATAAVWPIEPADFASHVSGYAHAMLIGPGAGRTAAARQRLDAALAHWTGPTVLDADAITMFEGALPELARALNGRPALLTPHVSEFARLAGTTVDDVQANRFEIARDAARILGATILLKGVPTVITAPNGRTMVSATGTPVLAAAGSGDVLGGIAVTLLAQTGDAFASGAAAAWIHGRAAEIAQSSRGVRGTTISDVVNALPSAWTLSSRPFAAPALARLPDVGSEWRRSVA
jgi:NAD(P)H-hydrate epimerase